MIGRWSWDEPKRAAKFFGQPFVAIDPGGDGAALLISADYGTFPRYVQAYDLPLLAEEMSIAGVSCVVLETQFVRPQDLKRVRSILELGFRTGMALGFLAAELERFARKRGGSGNLDLFEVAPATWQAHQRGGGRATRGQGIKIAMRAADRALTGWNVWHAASDKRREGIASAWGITEWWIHQTTYARDVRKGCA